MADHSMKRQVWLRSPRVWALLDHGGFGIGMDGIALTRKAVARYFQKWKEWQQQYPHREYEHSMIIREMHVKDYNGPVQVDGLYFPYGSVEGLYALINKPEKGEFRKGDIWNS